MAGNGEKWRDDIRIMRVALQESERRGWKNKAGGL